MVKPERLSPPQILAEPLARAKKLAEKMARVLNDGEDVSDVAVAIALLTSGVVNHYAGDPVKVRQLVDTIRRLEDRLLAETVEPGDLTLQ
jgi:hypothetical protein